MSALRKAVAGDECSQREWDKHMFDRLRALEQQTGRDGALRIIERFVRKWHKQLTSKMRCCLTAGLANGFAPSTRNSDPAKPFTPEVTVIVPNFNHARYLPQRLDSIYGQTYPHFRVILLDDCSTDGSQQILADYARKFSDRTELIVNAVNGGSVFSQWSKGIQLARSELVWIAESDDACDLNLLEQLVPFFRDEAVQIAYGRTVFIGPEGEPLDFTFDSYVGAVDRKKWKQSYVETAHREVGMALGIRNTIPNVSSAVFRHPGNLPLLANPEWLKMRICGDWVFYLHLARGGKIAFTPNTQNYYRYHQSNASRSTYQSPVYYSEHEQVAKTVLQLYKVDLSVLEQQRQFLIKHWDWVYRESQAPDWKLQDYYDLGRIVARSSARPPNVLVVSHDFATGGGEVFAIRLAEALSAQGCSVTFLDFDGTPSKPEFRKLLACRIPVVQFRRKQMNLRWVLDDFGIEIVHTHHARTDYRFAKLFSPRSRRPRHVVTLHGMYEAMDSPELERRFARIRGAVDHWIYTADKNLEPFRARGLFDPTKFSKISLGMCCPKPRAADRTELGIPDDAFVVCVASRALFEKGWIEAIKAVELARSMSGRNLHLVFIGEGPVVAHLQQQGTPAFVHLLGFKRNPVDYFAMANVGLLATRYRSESCPLVVIECLMAGRPVVASDVGEIRNMLTTPDGQIAGALISLQDWQVPVEALAATLSRMAEDESVYRQAQSATEAAASRFKIEQIAEQYCAIYQQLLDRSTLA